MSIISTNQNIRVILKGIDKIIIDETAKKIIEAVKPKGTETLEPITLTSSSNIIFNTCSNGDNNMTVDELLNAQGYQTIIDILNPDPKAVDALLQVELPEGVDIEIKL